MTCIYKLLKDNFKEINSITLILYTEKTLKYDIIPQKKK